MKEERYSPTNS